MLMSPASIACAAIPFPALSPSTVISPKKVSSSVSRYRSCRAKCGGVAFAMREGITWTSLYSSRFRCSDLRSFDLLPGLHRVVTPRSMLSHSSLPPNLHAPRPMLLPSSPDLGPVADGMGLIDNKKSAWACAASRISSGYSKPQSVSSPLTRRSTVDLRPS